MSWIRVITTLRTVHIMLQICSCGNIFNCIFQSCPELFEEGMFNTGR